MKQIFKNIFTPKTLLFLLVGIVLFDFIEPNQLLAAGSKAGAAESNDDIIQSLGKILSLVIRMLTFFATFIIAVGGELLGSDLIIGEVAEKGLKSVWVFMRNITNIGFILVLIYLAMSNLFAMGDSGGSWNWTIKDKLPKLIIALIAINGSFLAFKVAIQVIDVGAVAILSIPDTAIESAGMRNLKSVLESPVNDFRSEDDTATQPFYKVFNDMFCNGKEAKPENCLVYIDKDQIDKLTDDALSKNILVAFGVHFMHLEQLPGLAARLNNLGQVIDNTVFATLMAIMFIIALVAMFIVMIVRIAALWLFMAFSPLIVAGGIMGVSDGGSNISAKIVTYLIIPLKISAIFAITFIMMSILGDYTPQVMGVEWLKVGNSTNTVSLFTILWQLMIVAIFWNGAFWALSDTVAQEVVQGIKGGAEKVGGFALKTATVDRPLFKVPGMDKAVGIGAIGNIPDVLGSIRSTRTQEQKSEIMKVLGGDKKMIEASNTLAEATNNMGDKNKQSVVQAVIGKTTLEALKNGAISDIETWASDIARDGKGENIIKAVKDYKNSPTKDMETALKKAIRDATSIDSTDYVKFKNSPDKKDEPSVKNDYNINVDAEKIKKTLTNQGTLNVDVIHDSNNISLNRTVKITRTNNGSFEFKVRTDEVRDKVRADMENILRAATGNDNFNLSDYTEKVDEKTGKVTYTKIAETTSSTTNKKANS